MRSYARHPKGVYDDTVMTMHSKARTQQYTKELRLEAVRLVTEGGLSFHEASMRPSMPKIDA